MKNAYKIFSENLKRRNHDPSEDLWVDGKMILECILEKQDGKLGTVFNWFKIGTSGGLL